MITIFKEARTFVPYNHEDFASSKKKKNKNANKTNKQSKRDDSKFKLLYQATLLVNLQRRSTNYIDITYEN